MVWAVWVVGQVGVITEGPEVGCPHQDTVSPSEAEVGRAHI